jgi:putative FmdB family regulatory protein
MPTYTYQCENCGVRFDQYQKFTEDTLVICPECNEPALRKVFQPVGIVFKGKGFYATDNRSPSGQSYHSEKEDSGKKDSESKTEPKTESKTEPKPEKSNATEK